MTFLIPLPLLERKPTIAGEFVDVETAKQAGRGHFGEMITFLKANANCRTILVEKTDRLYSNFRDYVTLEDLQVTIHFVKEHAVLWPDSRSSDKLMHNIKVAMAKNYVDNLGEEVKKGMREKAEQGHWPSMAPIGYVNNPVTHRIAPDLIRAPLIAELFRLYAAGNYSISSLHAKAYEIGLTHPRTGRRLFRSEVHKILRNPIYYGDFRWGGHQYSGVHTPLITREAFDEAQAILRGRPHARKVTRRHPFMGLLTCARCGCAMTAELKKCKYVYYHCTQYHGACDNTYVREEQLAKLLGDTIRPIQISPDIAEEIATAIQTTETDVQRRQADALAHLELRRRAVQGKLDRGYEDFVERRISEEFWVRKSAAWESEL
ncbi:MAG TPA: recombinase family protein [Vicinamibacterales bacterium]|nr:recombinase family protein [Vicinamibacterales bacterium]